MELSAHTMLSFPRELVFVTYRDHLPEVVPFLPNVASIEVRSRREEGGAIRLVNVWTGKTEIPSVARRFIKADMLSWTDYADWDQGAWRCQWRLETHAFPGFMECTGTTSFHESGPERTEVRVSGTLNLHLERAHIPRLLAGTVQPLLEKVVVSGIKPNLLSTGEGLGKFLQAKRQAPT